MVAEHKKYLVYGATLLLVVAAVIVVIAVPRSSQGSAKPSAPDTSAGMLSPTAEDLGVPAGTDTNGSQNATSEAPAVNGQNNITTNPPSGTKRNRRSRGYSTETTDEYLSTTEASDASASLSSDDNARDSRHPQHVNMASYWTEPTIRKVLEENADLNQLARTHYLLDFSEAAEMCTIGEDLISAIALAVLDKLYSNNNEIEMPNGGGGILDRLKEVSSMSISDFLIRIDLDQSFPENVFTEFTAALNEDYETVIQYVATKDQCTRHERIALLDALRRLISYAILHEYLRKTAYVYDTANGKLITDSSMLNRVDALRFAWSLLSAEELAAYDKEVDLLSTEEEQEELFVRRCVRKVIEAFIVDPAAWYLSIEDFMKKCSSEYSLLSTVGRLVADSLSIFMIKRQAADQTYLDTEESYAMLVSVPETCLILFMNRVYVALSKYSFYRLFAEDAEISDHVAHG